MFIFFALNAMVAFAEGTTASCTAEEYYGVNEGVCKPKRSQGDYCNVVQECHMGLFCNAANTCDSGVPRCSDLTTEQLVPYGTVAVPQPLTGHYSKAPGLAPSLYNINGFQWPQGKGKISVQVELLAENFTKFMGVPYVKQQWCNEKTSSVHWDIDLFGICEFDGPDSDYHYYKAIVDLEIFNDCMLYDAGVCRIVKVGKDGTSAAGKYVEGQDGPAPASLVKPGAKGGAIEFMGDQMKLHWEICPTEITFEQVVSTKI